MTTALPVPTLTPEHREYLLRHAIKPSVLDASGIFSADGALWFPWCGPGPDGDQFQRKPDDPRKDDHGEIIKYENPPGVRLPFNLLRDLDADAPVVFVEGTKQQYAVLSYAPQRYAVYGVSGCHNWSGLPLDFVEGRDVLVLFDGDVRTNPNVHQAAKAFHEALEDAGALSIAHVHTTARDKQGVDDVLAALPDDATRTRHLSRWLAGAKTSLGKKPARKASNPFFNNDGLMVQKLAEDILKERPAALTAEGAIALYTNGVYRIEGDMPLTSAVVRRLGDQHRAMHMSSAKQAVQAALFDGGKRLPEKMTEPIANFLNVMVDLRTGAEIPQDPGYMSRTQHPVVWDAGAQCPVYERWLKDVIPDQMDDLEEIAGSMLDPSRTPAKALFAFGPSHSGKSTFIRLLAAVAGQHNTSAVTLHQLSEDRFAAANVYGMCLNAASDLSATDVGDLSVFKMMSGEDLIQANRKYGQQFSFTARALFAFSANALPNVGESSRAYINRVKPFHFSQSFEGREDPTIEQALMSELPGIVKRWAVAYFRFLTRGKHLPTLPQVAAQFEQGSDRVRQWAATQTLVAEFDPSSVPLGAELVVDSATASTLSELHVMFELWARANGGKGIGKIKFGERLASMDGVYRVRFGPQKRRGFNVIMRPDQDRE